MKENTKPPPTKPISKHPSKRAALNQILIPRGSLVVIVLLVQKSPRATTDQRIIFLRREMYSREMFRSTSLPIFLHHEFLPTKTVDISSLSYLPSSNPPPFLNQQIFDTFRDVIFANVDPYSYEQFPAVFVSFMEHFFLLIYSFS